MIDLSDLTLKQLMTLENQISSEIFYRTWWIIPLAIVIFMIVSHIMNKCNK